MRRKILGSLLIFSLGLVVGSLLSSDPPPICPVTYGPHFTYDLPTRPTTFKGKVSWYSTQECENPDCITKSGERFTDDGFTGACLADYPFGSRFRLVYRGRSVSFVCNDRGGFGSLGRVLDVSPAVFSALAPLSAGVITAEIEVLHDQRPLGDL